MLHPYMTVYLIEILTSFFVPPQYISVNYSEQHNNLVVLVYKPNSKDFYSVEFSVPALSFGDKQVQEKLYKAALWYHDGSIPERQSWWHSQNRPEQVLWLWCAAGILIVLLSIAKLYGVYK